LSYRDEAIFGDAINFVDDFDLVSQFAPLMEPKMESSKIRFVAFGRNLKPDMVIGWVLGQRNTCTLRGV